MINYRNVFQSCHLNFLIGSGVSSPFFKTLSNIEEILTEIDLVSSEKIRKRVRASVLNKYFKESIEKNIQLHDNFSKFKSYPVGADYALFFDTIHSLVLHRKNNLISKQVNLFTTNMDIFQECALENLSYEYNDGFSGYISPKFSLSNFKKSILKISPHYGVSSELPLFNLYKLHGSVTWKERGGAIVYNRYLKSLKNLSDFVFGADQIIDPSSISVSSTAEDLSELAEVLKQSKNVDDYLDLYGKMAIINPTKDKFHSTTLNYTYYELLRMFSNELERENSVLFVMGFSFADEHLREIVLRCAKANPTLIIYVFAYDQASEDSIIDLLFRNGIHHNIEFIERETDDKGVEVKLTLDRVENFFKAILNDVKFHENKK